MTAKLAAKGVDQPPSTVSPPVASRPSLFFSVSMLRVIAEIQAGEVDSFHPWHECPGPYGGRLGGSERQIAELLCPDVAAPPQTNIEKLSSWTAQPFFSVTAPASFTAAVSDELDANNDRHTNAVQGVMPGWVEGSVLRAAAQAPPRPLPGGVTQWSFEPNQEWHECPAHCRPAVGRELLVTAWIGPARAAPEKQTGGMDRDLWVDPLVVSYLNIGFHKLERSLSEIAQLILCHRPDVLFLGDIGVARNKIERLKAADGEQPGGRVVHVDKHQPAQEAANKPQQV
jgi:hypothetical protein